MVKQNSKVFLEENFFKRHETAVVDELDRGVRNKWVWVRMQMKTFMHRTLGNLMFLDKQCAQYVINIARARFLVYRHRTWEGNTGYALSCRPVNYTCM